MEKYYTVIKDIVNPVINLRKNTIFKKDDTGFFILNDKDNFDYSFLNCEDKSIFDNFEMPTSEIDLADYVHFKNDECAVYQVTDIYTKMFRGKPVIYADLRYINRGTKYKQDKMSGVDIKNLMKHETYWFINSEGQLSECLNTPKYTNATKFRKKIGNYFTTKELADKKLQKLLK